MASFLRLEIWTDASCNSGARVATLEPSPNGVLQAALLKLSLTGVESLTFTIPRACVQAAEVVHGRIARVCWSDATRDTEWRIADDTITTGTGDRGALVVACQAMALDLSVGVYRAYDSQGRISYAVSGEELTPTQYLTTFAVVACQQRNLYPTSVGTVDFTNLFDLIGEYQSARQIVNALLDPARTR